MKHDLEWLNSLSAEQAANELRQCCGSKRWVEQMVNARPFENLANLVKQANEIWLSLDRDDWLEAFRSHPRIGEKKTAETVSAQARQWSSNEQAGVNTASSETTNALATLNRAYEQKFGYIFIICATGKTSVEMLAALRERLDHDDAEELPIAAAEQSKITELRLKKLLTGA
jgi:allantoicase